MFVPYVLQSAGLIAVLLVGRTSGTAFTMSLIALYFIWGSMFSLSPRSLATTMARTVQLPIMASYTWPKALQLSSPGGLPLDSSSSSMTGIAVFYGAAAMAFVSANAHPAASAFMPLPRLNKQDAPALVTAKAG